MSQPFIQTICSHFHIPGLTKGSIPVGQRRVKSQIYDNIIIHPSAKQKKRISAPGGYGAFDPLMEETGDRDNPDREREDRRGKDKGVHDVNLNLEKGMGSTAVAQGAEEAEEEQLDENEEWAKVSGCMMLRNGQWQNGSLTLKIRKGMGKL